MTSNTINNANIVYNTALSYGANDLAAKIIAAQAMFESGNFTSSLFQRSNNAFGMNVPTTRPAPYVLGKDPSSSYAAYASLADSTRDLIDWLNYNNIDYNSEPDPASYVADISSSGYFSAPENEYSTGVTNEFNSIVGFLKDNSLTGLAILAGVLFIMFLLF